MWSYVEGLDSAGDVSHLGNLGGRPYRYLGCETGFEVQYHTCPACGGYDVRRAGWIGA